MIRELILLTLILFFTISLGLEVIAQTDSLKNKNIPDTPLFRDPVFDGASDPTVFWNYEEQNWWMIYTQRRANIESFDLAWVHGTAIGIASSDNGGISWKYRGTLDLHCEPGHNTYWAPEIIRAGDEYHLFVSFVQGIPVKNFDDIHKIAHFKGKDMWDLEFIEFTNLNSDRVIDPSVIELPDGKYRMWFKNENAGYVTHYADSKDLIKWEPKGEAIGDNKCEGVQIFKWKDAYWMITDPWHGIDIFRSENATTWSLKGTILANKGQRKDDTSMGHHACVISAGDFAYIFYHVNPEESFGVTSSWSTISYRERRSVIQVARLSYIDGKIICDRDIDFPLEMPEKE